MIDSTNVSHLYLGFKVCPRAGCSTTLTGDGLRARQKESEVYAVKQCSWCLDLTFLDNRTASLVLGQAHLT